MQSGPEPRPRRAGRWSTARRSNPAATPSSTTAPSRASPARCSRSRTATTSPTPRSTTARTLTGARLDVLGNPKPGSTIDEGFQYLEMRDGVRAERQRPLPRRRPSTGPAPWPTVVEYSGYSPSNPASEEAGVRIARALGYATVSVNMRGTGCSGGVFDVFNPAQMADGYDVDRDRRPPRTGCSAARSAWSACPTRASPSSTRRPPNPPHLAGVTAQSVIADPWLQAWPGGIFNSGFTQQWIKERNAAVVPGRHRAGSPAASRPATPSAPAHQPLRNQNPDFENLARSLDELHARRPRPATCAAGPRHRGARVHQRGVPGRADRPPVHARCSTTSTRPPRCRVNLWNGRHPDGYAPANLNDVVRVPRAVRGRAGARA